MGGLELCAGTCGGSNCRAGCRRSGDYGGARLALLLLALPYVRARRLEPLQYLVGDPLVRRFAGAAPPGAAGPGLVLRR
jgi:hypothetical protein